MKPILKICGVMNADDAAMCHGCGADMLGFVVDYPEPVPWDIGADEAARLLSFSSVAHLPCEKCIVTGGSVDKIIALARRLRPDCVQVHDFKSPEEIAFISGELLREGIKTIKTIFPETPDIEKTAKEFAATSVHALLLDPRKPGSATTSGAANTELFARLKATTDKPLILAGGITHENAQHLLKATGAEHIDVLTGSESRPGAKDRAKIERLVAALLQ